MSRPVITVSPGDSIKEAARLLVTYAVSALPVVDAQGDVVGIVSEADLLPMEARPDPRAQATPLKPTAGTGPHSVADVMTSRVVTVPAVSEVWQAARTMIESGVKRLPVMSGRRLVGIVSRRDLVKVIAREDGDVQAQVTRRLGELGLGTSKASVSVSDGVATIRIEDRGAGRRLAESVALTVPGVLEVRFERDGP